MRFGEIADETGAIWIRWWAGVEDRSIAPNAFVKADHGYVWLTPRQAEAANPFGWRAVEDKDNLIKVYRQKGNGDAKLS